MQAFLAPAKLNLTLKVGPPGHNGRHDLDSLVCFTKGLGDIIAIEPAAGLSLEVTGPFATDLASEADNLVLRAARLLAASAGITPDASLILTKNLPVASGIGGGSADAAAALHGLNALWGLGLTVEELMTLSAPLGADVPVCVLGQPAHMTGTGETVSPTGPVAALGLVLINPGLACPTGPVYRRYDDMGHAQELRLSQVPDVSTPDQLLAYLADMPNDLETPAISLVREIGDALALLAASPGVRLARMSGSGATCFGIYDDGEAARTARDHILRELGTSSYWVEADEIQTMPQGPTAGDEIK